MDAAAMNRRYTDFGGRFVQIENTPNGTIG